MEGFKNKHLLVIVFFRADSIMYSTANYIRIESEERYRAIKFLAIIAITAMMAIPIIQHIQNEYASTPVESYSYYNGTSMKIWESNHAEIACFPTSVV